MGTVIRLKNVSIGESPLGTVQTVFLKDLKVGFTPRTSLGNSIYLPTGETPTLVGAPEFKEGYLESDGNVSYINTGFLRDSSKSFTICTVVRRDELPPISDITNNVQMYFGDYSSEKNGGIGIISTTAEGIRPALSIILNRPSQLRAAPIGEWLYVVFRVDLEKKETTFSCPSVDSKVVESFTGIPVGTAVTASTLTIGGGSSVNILGKSKVAFTAYYERALSDSELALQQSKAVDYCDSVGVRVML